MLQRRRGGLAVLVLLAGLVLACATAGPGPQRAPLEGLAKLQNGEQLDLAGLRGRPVVIVLFATSDSASEIQMPEVQKVFVKIGGNVHVLALSVDPNDEALLPAYAEFMKLGFPIGIAPDEVRTGKSSLGPLPIVPAVVLLDADGSPRETLLGVQPATVIEKKALDILGPVVPPPVHMP